MNKFITAKEAYDIAYNNEYVENELTNIYNIIINAANIHKFSVPYYKILSLDARDYLTGAGFTIEWCTDSVTQKYYNNISWNKNYGRFKNL